jgi:A/G-specific adenine glycosylase
METLEGQHKTNLGGKIERVQSGLLDWFRKNQRDLPWRRTRDPYRILVSEIMLQQTQVDRVIPYYERFLERFPTVEALAAASAAEVIQLWAGLGYNRRAVNLQRTAQAVMDDHSGTFPDRYDDLLKLPGIGPYTAGAISSFAFERDAAFIDTNMRRVLHRLFVGVDVPKPTVPDREIIEHARQLIPAGQGWSWNQGLIEFGALQCTARKPACIICPLQADCEAFPAIQAAIRMLPVGKGLKRETPFKESNRYYRGRVLAALRDHASSHGSLALDDLGPLVKSDYDASQSGWLIEVVRGLERDGLARVAEERPEYDTGTPESARVSLP